MMPKQVSNRVIIRKYATRRLYNTNTSSYVTINDLALMVKDSIDFSVVEVTTGKDLTRFTLFQIILEIESEGHRLLPIAVLQQLIRFYGDRMEPILSRHLERTMDAFFSHKGHAEDAPCANLNNIRSDAVAANKVHLAQIPIEFNQLKTKLDRLG